MASGRGYWQFKVECTECSSMGTELWTHYTFLQYGGFNAARNIAADMFAKDENRKIRIFDNEGNEYEQSGFIKGYNYKESN